MTQLVVRLDDASVASIDDLVAAGEFASRSDAVRKALELLLDRHRRDAIGARIVASYSEHPQSVEEGAWADAATVRMIADEPW